MDSHRLAAVVLCALVVVFGCKGRGPAERPEPAAPAKAVTVTMPSCLGRCMALRQQLRTGHYDEVEQFFRSFEDAVRGDCALEFEFQRAIECFRTTDQSLGPALDGWVEALPNSWLALTCRALYRLRIGYLIRSARWASQVSEEQWQGYEALSELAEEDLNRAMSLNDQFFYAYSRILNLSHHHADREVLEKGLDAAPWSYTIRASYMWYLQPKWGGSLQAMDAFVEEAAQEAIWNPNLLHLREYPAYTRAELPYRSGKILEAEKIIGLELKKTPTLYLYQNRAYFRSRLHHYREALDDAESALAISPCNAEALRERLGALFGMQQGKGARIAADILIALDPLNITARWFSSALNFRAGREQQAVVDMRIVTTYDPSNGPAWNNLGFSLLNLKKYAEAEEALTRAIELEHDSFVHARFNRGKARYMQHKESAIEDLRAFVKRKQEALKRHQEGGSTKERLDWAERVLAAPPDKRFSDANVPR